MEEINNLQDALRLRVPSDLGRMVFTREVDGTKLSAQVDPCVWMHNNYPLQITVTMAGNGGTAHLTEASKTFTTAQPEDVQRLLDSVTLCKCRKCGQPAFDPKTAKTNRNGKCEACFMAELRTEFDKAEKKEAEKLAKLDAKYKSQGCTHRVSAWVHPKAGGDDYQVDFWSRGEPSKDEITKLLKKRGSSVMND